MSKGGTLYFVQMRKTNFERVEQQFKLHVYRYVIYD